MGLLHGGGSVDDPVPGWVDAAPSLSAPYRADWIEHRGHGRTDNPMHRTHLHLVGPAVPGFLARYPAATAGHGAEPTPRPL